MCHNQHDFIIYWALNGFIIMIVGSYFTPFDFHYALEFILICRIPKCITKTDSLLR